MNSHAYRVELCGSVHVPFSSNHYADCVRFANQLADTGRRAFVWSMGGANIVYRNWTPSAASEEGRALIAQADRLAGLIDSGRASAADESTYWDIAPKAAALVAASR